MKWLIIIPLGIYIFLNVLLGIGLIIQYFTGWDYKGK